MKIIDLTETYFQKLCCKCLLQNSTLDIWDKSFNKWIIIIGDLRKLQHICLIPFFKKVVIVDDGLVTVNYLEGSKHLSWVRSPIKRIIMRLILKVYFKKILYYTIFLDENKAINKSGISFLGHNLGSHKVDITAQNQKKLLVGCPIVELGFMEEKVYLNILSDLVRAEGTIYYYPHRREQKKYSVPGLVYIERHGDFLEYISKSDKFSKVFGIASTALAILPTLGYSMDSIYFIEIDEKLMRKTNKELPIAFNYLQKYGIRRYKLYN